MRHSMRRPWQQQQQQQLHQIAWQRLRLPPLLLLLIVANLSSAVEQPQQQRKSLSDYSEADLDRLYKQWEESDPDDEPEARTWKSPQLDLTKMADLTDPTHILQHSSRGQPVLLSVKIAGSLDKASLETLSHRWQLEMFNAHMETTRRVHDDGRVLLVALDGSQVSKVREYLLQQVQCYSVDVEGHTTLGRGAASADAAAKTEL